jgi:hypothetical protein
MDLDGDVRTAIWVSPGFRAATTRLISGMGAKVVLAARRVLTTPNGTIAPPAAAGPPAEGSRR